jgi:hypothetical protein
MYERGDAEITRIIREDFYVDYLMTCANSVQECVSLQKRLSKQLEKNWFHFRKWLANKNKIFQEIPKVTENEVFHIDNNEFVKTLGLRWQADTDNFTFNINVNKKKDFTKRKALSDMAKIFDPIGWLTPITVVAKLFIQKLWTMKMSWDQKLDGELLLEWTTFFEQLDRIEDIQLPMWLNIKSESQIQIHGFADASEKAYAAAVYTKVQDPS